MKTIATLVLFIAITGKLMPLQAQTIKDTVRVEYTQETVSFPAKTDPERAKAEKTAIDELYSRSREERTLFMLRFTDGLQPSFITNRLPVQERAGWVGLETGVEHKVHPAWALLGSVQAGFAGGRRNGFSYKGYSLDGIGGVAWYPCMMRMIRKGKSANNFLRQTYISALLVTTIHDRITATRLDSGERWQTNLKPYNQLITIQIGQHSRRTKWFDYNFSFGAGYLIGPDPGIRRHIQAVFRSCVGLAL
ncbi:hypothetical protein [Arsenicibacter rosenii]|uniref:DUF3575 domain-containing protein n=1 Tax=Arsenicibacter rosenii TaxID=1750698 RepID=A0A1S2VD91_9BACT|nr:hypothetical protein [Arsenicibacter rosenii]OIN56662.1 hypothetical protein BLX24_23840 [Arsenicibacter rosenii]